MKPRIFLDTNVFIYGFEYSNSNSAKIIALLNQGAFEAIISERVLRETTTYFKRYHTNELSGLFHRYLLTSCTIVRSEQIQSALKKYKGMIKDKDLEQLAVTKELSIKYLISYDRDFSVFEEYKTPKAFLKMMKIKEVSTDY